MVQCVEGSRVCLLKELRAPLRHVTRIVQRKMETAIIGVESLEGLEFIGVYGPHY